VQVVVVSHDASFALRGTAGGRSLDGPLIVLSPPAVPTCQSCPCLVCGDLARSTTWRTANSRSSPRGRRPYLTHPGAQPPRLAAVRIEAQADSGWRSQLGLPEPSPTLRRAIDVAVVGALAAFKNDGLGNQRPGANALLGNNAIPVRSAVVDLLAATPRDACVTEFVAAWELYGNGLVRGRWRPRSCNSLCERRQRFGLCR
jgi:hypothetical protein